MRIAQISPLYESVPPAVYGGTERVVHFLTEELVRMGHDVTLFASGDSASSANLVAICPRALRWDRVCRDPLAWHMVMLDQVASQRERFDALHFHIDYLHFLLSRHLRLPQLTTLHGRLDLPELQGVYDHFGDMPVVSISDAQRGPVPQANWVGTVHHGLPEDLLRFAPEGGSYLAFLGRISPEKRVDRAIHIASALGVPLKIAAKVDRVDEDYFNEEIVPLLNNPLVEFVGEIDDSRKSAFLGAARALLFPIDWPEPFGLVMIEAMACGTPVVAFDGGSVREVIDPGITGFIVNDHEQAIEATRLVGDLDRRRIRDTFERRFTARRMAEDYLRLYEHTASADPRAVTVAA